MPELRQACSSLNRHPRFPQPLLIVGVKLGRAQWMASGRLADEWLAFDDVYGQPYGPGL